MHVFPEAELWSRSGQYLSIPPYVQAIQVDPEDALGHIAACVSMGRLALCSDNRQKVGAFYAADLRGSPAWLTESERKSMRVKGLLRLLSWCICWSSTFCR